MSPLVKPTLRVMEPNSLRQRVTRELRNAIISRTFQPGDRVIEEDIAAQMGISRGTVREALRQLEHEGLVVSYPYRGTEVAHISAEELQEVLFPIRLILERSAFLRVLPRLGVSDYAHLAAIIEEMQQAALAGDLMATVDLDVAFHRHIIQQANMPHLEQIWDAITPRMRVFFVRNNSTHASLDEVVMEHRDLLRALEMRDEATVLKVLDAHIRVPIAEDLE